MEEQMEPDDYWITAEKVCQRLKLPASTLWDMVRANKIPHARLSPRVVRFNWKMIEAWMEAHKKVDAVKPD
jgi:excisionase family DNA binding protein